MNLILLSGGSGQRLWPLSNNIRSKQFVPLLKNAAGEHESMVQRVYRQIMAADPGANIVVATGKRQVSTIRNQLGGKVSVCVEPCRRDTFPAIVLACAYLGRRQGRACRRTGRRLPGGPVCGRQLFPRRAPHGRAGRAGQPRRR